MIVRQWEVWKHPALGSDHWYVIISGPDRSGAAKLPKVNQLNGLICYTQRGPAYNVDVILDQADGFTRPTVCQCDLFWPIQRNDLRDKLGTVSEFRQSAIIRKIIEVFRLIPR